MRVEISPVKSEVLIEVVQPRSKANVARKQSSQAGKRRKGMGRKEGSHRGADEGIKKPRSVVVTAPDALCPSQQPWDPESTISESNALFPSCSHH